MFSMKQTVIILLSASRTTSTSSSSQPRIDSSTRTCPTRLAWRPRAQTVDNSSLLYADLSPVVGSEQGGVRPVLIVQNDTGNRHSPTVIAAAITSQTGKARLPTHISVAPLSCGLPKESIILLEQVRTLDKRRLREKMGRLDDGVMRKVDAAIAVSFGLHPETLV